MKKYYLNRELSAKVGLPIAKWKRWSREFLPPDPVGGYRSGYARHYNLREALRVFLGGHLVADLRFTVAEARQILTDLEPWLIREILPKIGQVPIDAGGNDTPGRFEIHIRLSPSRPKEPQAFCYTLQELAAFQPGEPEGGAGIVALYRLTLLGDASPIDASRPPSRQVLMVSELAAWFFERLGLGKGKEGGRTGDRC